VTPYGTCTDTIIAIDFTKKIILIGNSSYAGEMKKSVFTTLNFYLPAQGVMPMHCSANVGKTATPRCSSAFPAPARPRSRPTRTASSSATTSTVGALTACSIFEGGCYAKCIKLSEEAEPDIYAATNRFGAVLENVVFDPQTRIPNYDDDSKT